MKKKNIGSTFDNWLSEEGIFEEVTVAGLKRVLARQIVAAMKEKHFSKTEMARRMHTSRTTLGRLLDPEHDAVTLSTLRKIAAAVGRELGLSLFRVKFSHWLRKKIHRPPDPENALPFMVLSLKGGFCLCILGRG